MTSRYRSLKHRTRLLIDEALTAVKRGFSDDVSQQLRPVEIAQLEQRILMSASPVAFVADVPESAAVPEAAETTFDVPAVTEVPAETAEESGAAVEQTEIQATVELVVIDPSADGHEQFVADLQSQEDRVFQILVLNPHQDGIAQITDSLQSLDRVSAIHLVSHGDEGEILLGTSVLSQRSIDRYAAELVTWQDSMTPDADLLIYGCNLAATDSGVTLTKSLNTLTGADVAASDDGTGHTTLGGDWELEHQVGDVETTVPFLATTQTDWVGLLTLDAYEPFNYSAGSLDGANGGSGWATAWTLTTGNSAIVNSTGLSGPAGLPGSVGGTAQMNTTFIFQQHRDLVRTLGTDNTTAWFSFLIETNGISGGLSLLIGDGDGATNTVNVGTSGNDLLVGIDGTATGTTISNAVVDGQTYFLVVQVDFAAGNDTVTLYLDPTAGESSPDSLPAATAQLTTADLGTFTRVGLIGGFAGNATQIDEIRVGTTFTDVAGGSTNQAPTANVGGPYAINEGDTLNLDASASSDPETDSLTYTWDLDNDGQFDDATGETPSIAFASLPLAIRDNGTYTIGVRADDGNGNTNDATTTLTITNVAPTLSTTGTGSATAGSAYTLNLSATDPGNDSITSWTINWGDGTIDTIAGNPSTATHTYTATAAGFTFNILASATDDDGTYLQNELLVASGGNDRVMRFGRDGAFLEEIAVGDGTDYPVDPVIGPDGNLYVSGWNSHNVLRYNATTGAFIDEFVTDGSGGLDSAAGLAFGPDGNLYVASRQSSEVLRFNVATGAFIDAFVTAGSGGLNQPEGLTFGPDGNLYVSDYQDDKVYKYDGTTGAFLAEFVTSGSGGLNWAEDVTFGPDGNLYVADNNSVLRYNGTTGAFIDAFVSSASGGLNFASGLTFGPDGNLYVGSFGTDNVLRFNGTTGAFIDEFVSGGSGGLDDTDYLNFIPEHQVAVTAPVNNQPTDISISNLIVPENAAAATIGTLSTTDPDTGDTFTYTVSDNRFELDGSQLKLKAGNSLDYESEQTVSISIISTDAGGLQTSKGFTITVLDANDTTPVIDAGQSFNVQETAANGASLGMVTATDDDTGTSFSGWAITGGNTDGIFAVNSGTGEITVIDNTDLSFATNSSYTLSLTVSDGTNTSVTETVAISVVQDNQTPVAIDDTYSLNEGGTLTEGVVSNWFNASWKQRQQIVFDNSAQASNLLNHAVLVTLHASDTDAVVIDYSETQSAGQDLRFVDGDGTLLNHEIESWDESGYSYVWVEVPQIDGGVATDFVWMYYNHSTVSDGQQKTATWNSDDVVVLHMNGNSLDSSPAGNDGGVVNVAISNGLIGGAGAFDGFTSGLGLGSDSSIDDVFAGTGTVSAWINATSWGEGNYGRIADKASNTLATNGDGWAFQVNGIGTNGKLRFEHGFTGTVGRWETSLGTLNAGTWHHVAVVFDSDSASSNPQFYIDGILQTTTEVVTPTGTTRSDAAIGLVVGNNNAGSRTFSGLIDEFHLSNAETSADEFAAHYAAATGSFGTINSTTNGPGGVLNNDSDANADDLTVSLVTGPVNANSFTLNADGSFTYVHDGSETTSDSFTYQTSDGTVSSTATVSLNITATNDAPTISAIANQTTPEDTAIAPITFTIADAETATGALVVSAVSSDQGIIPDANITLAGSGANRTISLVPASNVSGGPVTITVTVSDGTTSSTTSFLVSVTPVNDTPDVSTIANVSTAEDTPVGPLAFTVGDQETAAAALVVSATSDNQTLIPDASISLGGSGTNRTLSFTPASNTSGGPATITITVSDGTDFTTTDFQVTVFAVNDVPTISAIADQITAEDVLIDSLAFTIGDAETASNALVISAASSNQAIIPDANISLGGNGTNRTISIQPATNASGGPITITLTVSDGTTSSDTTFDVTVTAVNDAPAITSIADVNTIEDTAVGPIAFTISDAESAAATLVVSATSNSQALVPDSAIVLGGSGASRTISFTPAPNASGGPATITLTVSDGSTSRSRSFDVNIAAVNDAPTVSSMADIVTPEDTAVGPVAFTIGDTETSAASLVVTATSSDQTLIPNSAIVLGGSGTNRTLSLSPSANANGGPATITVSVSDGVTTTDTTFNVTVSAVNDAPTISGIADIVALENESVGPVAFTVSDLETPDTALVVTATSDNQALVANADIIISGSGPNRTISLTPVANANGGPASITVNVSDGTTTTATTFNVTFTAVNNAPSISNIADITTVEDTAVGPIAFTVADVDSAASTLVVSASSSNQALVADSAISLSGSGTNRTISFTPTANAYGGPATITVTVSDGSASSVTTFDVNITPVNDAPALSSIPDGTNNEDTSTGPISFTISDVDSAASSLSVTAISSDQGIFADSDIVISGTGLNRILTMIPVANFGGGSATITVTVSDGSLSSSVSFQQTVAPINDTPTISSIADITVTEDTASGPISFTVNDVESPATALTVAVTSADQSLITDASIIVSGTGTSRILSFTPVANAFGSTMLTVQASDGNTTGIRQIEVTVSPVNDVPTISVIADTATPEDTQAGPIVFALSDVDDALTDLVVTATSDNQLIVADTNLTISGVGANRQLVLLPAANAFGSTTISIAVSDGSLNDGAEFELLVTAVNDAPQHQSNADLTYSVSGDGTLTVAAGDGLLVNVADVEHDPLAVTVTHSPTHGTLLVNADGAFTYTPSATYTGTDSFRYKVTDGSDLSAYKTVNLTTPIAIVTSPSHNSAAPVVESSVVESPTDSTSESDTTKAETQSQNETAAQSPTTQVNHSASTSSSEDEEENAIAAPVVGNDDEETREFLTTVKVDAGESAFLFTQDGTIQTADGIRVNASALKSAFNNGGRGRLDSDMIGASDLPDIPHGSYAFEQYAELKGTAEQIEQFRQNIASNYKYADVAANVVTVGGTSIVIGSVVTALRTGVLALGLLSQLPVWTLFDPLMVMDGVSGDSTEDGDSLQDLVDKAANEQKNTPDTPRSGVD